MIGALFKLDPVVGEERPQLRDEWWEDPRRRRLFRVSRTSSIPASRHFSRQEIIFSQDSPTTAGLCGTSQVARREETENIQSQLFRQQRYEIALELWFNNSHHVTDLSGFTQLYQLVNGT